MADDGAGWTPRMILGLSPSAAFFGWLTATGTVVMLTAGVTALLALLGTRRSIGRIALAAGSLEGAGPLGIILMSTVLLVGYAAGGYVAGRLARSAGLRHGLAVWLWSVAIGAVAAFAGIAAGDRLGSFSQLGNAGLPMSGGPAATWIATPLVVLAFSLLGALLGGLAGAQSPLGLARPAAGSADGAAGSARGR